MANKNQNNIIDGTDGERYYTVYQPDRNAKRKSLKKNKKYKQYVEECNQQAALANQQAMHQNIILKSAKYGTKLVKKGFNFTKGLVGLYKNAIMQIAASFDFFAGFKEGWEKMDFGEKKAKGDEEKALAKAEATNRENTAKMLKELEKLNQNRPAAPTV